MAKRKSKGTLSERAVDSVADHKGDMTRYGIIDLPGGIKGGIAELTECRVGEYKLGTRNEGEPFLYLAGTIRSPESVNGVTVRGLFTSQLESLCDTTTTTGKEVSFDEHVSNTLNYLRSLGLDTDEYNDDQLEEMITDLNTVAKDATRKGPFFRFSTTWRNDDDHSKGAWENWQGNKGLENYEDETDSDDGVEDDTEEEEPNTIPIKKKGATKKKKVEKKEPIFSELLSLGKAADDEDHEAQEKLEAMCETAGINHEEYDTWEAVAIELKGEPEEEDETRGIETDQEEADKSEVTPEKGEVYWYKPPKKRKRVQIEITSVNVGREVCTAENTENEEKYRGILWRELSYEQD